MLVFYQNLDQWTLHNALLHLNLNINHVRITNLSLSLSNFNLLLLQHSTTQVEHLSQSVIQVFEDSCGDEEWSGQKDNDKIDGAYRYTLRDNC